MTSNRTDVCTSRRAFLQSTAALGVFGLSALSAIGEEPRKAKSVFEAVELNHISLDVTRSERSREFYQALFGMTPVSHGRGGGAAFLHFEEGFLNLRPADTAGMNHFCLSIKEFNVNSAYTMLNVLDLKPWVQGGGNLLHVYDPDGINVQVQETGHGWRRTRNQLTNADKGIFATVRLHHLSLNVTDVPRSRDFYREMFGLKFVSGDSSKEKCMLGVGQSLLELRKAEKPGMHHYCYAVKKFDADSAAKELAKAKVELVKTDESAVVSFRDPQNLLVQVSSVDNDLTKSVRTQDE